MKGAIPPALHHAQFIPVIGKKPACKNWPEVRLSLEDAERRLANGGNVAIRLGRASGDIVDIDHDCGEALTLAPLYLPNTAAIFGRRSKPQSHWFYIAPGAIFANFADPTDGSMLIELRADGRDGGGAHSTLIPSSVVDGERREWHGDTVEPSTVDAAVLTRRVMWLAIGCLVMRHVSEHAARRPGPDLPSILWEADPALGRAAYRWLGQPSPDEPRRYPRHRSEMTREELDLAELVAAISNNFDWGSWNRAGLAIFAASGGSEEGFVAFDDLSARSPKYNPHATRERWRNYRRSPPSRIGIGTLVHLARENGWRRSAA